MRKQKGQSAVELALILPLFFMMCFGMIYGGMAFMDYLQFNNTARVVARTISLSQEEEQREIAADFESNPDKYFNKLTKLYEVTPKVTFPTDPVDSVKVTINLTLNEEDLPKLLLKVNFPPKNLTAAEIVMPLENKN